MSDDGAGAGNGRTEERPDPDPDTAADANSNPDPAAPADAGRRRALDSPVVTKTVRLTTPFVLTFGLFTMFHGTSSVGGGFQGGVVAAAGVIAIGFSFGLTQTARWLSAPALTGLAVSGVLVFAAVAVGALALGAPFLDVSAYPVPKAAVYGTELVELGIGATVAAAVVVLFVQLGGEGPR